MPSTRASVLVLAALAAGLAACDRGRGDAAEHEATSAVSSLGPDPIVLRLPRAGGLVRAFVYPRLDSAVWTSSAPAPAPARVLAFDENAGSLAFVDAKGLPGRIDFRLGGVGRATRVSLASLESADGDAIYGVTKGKVARLTPSGDWTFEPPAAARDVFPQADGALVVVGERGRETVLWRIRPPEPSILDSLVLPRLGIAGDTAGTRVPRVQAGERLYFGVDSGLVGVRMRDLTLLKSIATPQPVLALAATPSGDRLFVLTDLGDAVSIVDRYTDRISREIKLPGIASALRVDPLGRLVLAKAAVGDSAWVLAVATDSVLGVVRGAWREDLPLVLPDRRVALAVGNDVVFVDGSTLRPAATVENGARDFWHLVRWNGLRPRARELDQPAVFAGADSTSADSTADSTAVPDTSAAAAPRDTVAQAPPVAAPPPASAGYTVQFAALLREDLARETAAKLRIGSEQARVVPTARGGATVYRVVLGPYPTREQAERVGRESHVSYWVYEGAP